MNDGKKKLNQPVCTHVYPPSPSPRHRLKVSDSPLSRPRSRAPSLLLRYSLPVPSLPATNSLSPSHRYQPRPGIPHTLRRISFGARARVCVYVRGRICVPSRKSMSHFPEAVAEQQSPCCAAAATAARVELTEGIGNVLR